MLILHRHPLDSVSDALSEKSPVRSYHVTVLTILCNVFIHHKAADGVKERGEGERISGQQRFKASVGVTMVISLKVPFDQMNK